MFELQFNQLEHKENIELSFISSKQIFFYKFKDY